MTDLFALTYESAYCIYFITHHCHIADYSTSAWFRFDSTGAADAGADTGSCRNCWTGK